MKRFTAFLAAGLLASTPSAADEFCDVLLRVVDDAPSAFDHLRWKPEAQRQPPKLPDMAGNCVIVPRGLGGPFHYVCLFLYSHTYVDPLTHQPVDDVRDYHPVTDRLEACLTAAGRNHVVEPPQNGEKFRMSTEAADIVITVRIPHDGNDFYYRLEVNQKS